MTEALEIVIHAGRLLAEPGQPPKASQSLRIAAGRITAVADGFVDPPPGARLIDLKDQLCPARPDRLPRPPDLAARPGLSAAPGRGLRPEDRPRLRAPGAADPRRRLHHRARRRRAQAGGHLRAARRGRRGQGPRAAHPLRRRDPVAHRRPRPGLRLPQRRLRLRAVGDRRLRRRRRLPQGGAHAGRPGRRRHQVRRHRRGALGHPRRRRPAVHHRRDPHHRRDRPPPRPPGRRPRPRRRPASTRRSPPASNSIEHGSFMDDEFDPTFPEDRRLPHPDHHRRHDGAGDGPRRRRALAGPGREGAGGRRAHQGGAEPLLQGRRQDQLRHRHGRRPARPKRPRVRLHGRGGHDAGGRDQGRHGQRRRAARHQRHRRKPRRPASPPTSSPSTATRWRMSPNWSGSASSWPAARCCASTLKRLPTLRPSVIGARRRRKTGSHWAKPPGKRHDRRSARRRRRARTAAEAALHPVRHEAFRTPRGDGGDPPDPASAKRPHPGPGRRPGLAPGLDRRHHQRGPGRRPMPRGRRAGPGARPTTGSPGDT